MAREMKNSGVRCIGEIPCNWSLTRFKYCFDTGSGLNITKADLVEDGLAVISYGQIHAKYNTHTHLSDDLLRYIPKELTIGKERSKLQRNDFVFADTSEDLDGCGNAAFIDTDRLIYAGYHTITARPIITGDMRFLAYLFVTQPWRTQLQQKVSGVKVNSITRTLLNECVLVLPPLFEQQAIADFLDKKCGEIDGLLEDLDAEIKTLTEYKKSLIAETVTHGLNPNATMKRVALGWIESLPEHWNIARIASVYSVRNEKVSDQDYQPLSVTMKGIVPQLENAAKTKHGDDRKLIRKGDFVINSRSDRRGSCGISPYDGSCSLINTVLAPREEMNPRYYNWLFHTTQFADEFYKWGYGIVNDLWTTNWGAMRRIQIPMPPLDEQAEIAAYLDERVPHIEVAISSKQDQIDQLKSYKASLIYEYVTGKKQVI